MTTAANRTGGVNPHASLGWSREACDAAALATESTPEDQNAESESAPFHTHLIPSIPPLPAPQEDRTDGGAVGPSLVRRLDDLLDRCSVMASLRPRSMFTPKHLASDLEKLVKVGWGRVKGRGRELVYVFRWKVKEAAQAALGLACLRLSLKGRTGRDLLQTALLSLRMCSPTNPPTHSPLTHVRRAVCPACRAARLSATRT